jgi:hypothetical protein
LPTLSIAVLATVIVVPTDGAVAVAILFTNHLKPGEGNPVAGVGVAVNVTAEPLQTVVVGVEIDSDKFVPITVRVATLVVSEAKHVLLMYARNL